MKRGMTILLAVLLVSTVLLISLSLFNITLKQIILSAVARDSRYAFYAADSARNCSLYWDRLPELAQRPFGYFWRNPTTNQHEFIPPTVTLFNCDGRPVSNRQAGGCQEVPCHPTVDDPFWVSFTIFFPEPDRPAPSCAQVLVKKYFYTLPGGGESYRTEIITSGYNLSNPTANECPLKGSERTVERIIKTTN